MFAASKSLQVQWADKQCENSANRDLVCWKPPAGLPGLCNCMGQLTAWALLTMLSNVPPSCCVVTSIWRSPARQISTPVRSFQQALLCKFNYSSVPHYCWLTAPWTNLTLTVGSHFYLPKVPHLFLLNCSLVLLMQNKVHSTVTSLQVDNGSLTRKSFEGGGKYQQHLF